MGSDPFTIRVQLDRDAIHRNGSRDGTLYAVRAADMSCAGGIFISKDDADDFAVQILNPERRRFWSSADASEWVAGRETNEFRGAHADAEVQRLLPHALQTGRLSGKQRRTAAQLLANLEDPLQWDSVQTSEVARGYPAGFNLNANVENAARRRREQNRRNAKERRSKNEQSLRQKAALSTEPSSPVHTLVAGSRLAPTTSSNAKEHQSPGRLLSLDVSDDDDEGSAWMESDDVADFLFAIEKAAEGAWMESDGVQEFLDKLVENPGASQTEPPSSSPAGP